MGSIGGKFPLNERLDFTYLGRYIPGKWVTIIDESKEPITLAEIRVYGSK